MQGGTTVVATPAGKRTVLATDYSMTLSDLLVPFMKLSNNMHAEALTKAMGAKRSGAPGTWSNGLAATRAYLTSSKVPMSGVSLSDGSGLTRANTLTPRALGALLVKVQQRAVVRRLQGVTAGGRQQQADGRRHLAAPDERHPGRRTTPGRRPAR